MTVPGLFGLEGELVSLRIRVEPKHLEDLLEALALLDFPVNPQLYHRPGSSNCGVSGLFRPPGEVGDAIRNHGFKQESLEVSRILV